MLMLDKKSSEIFNIVLEMCNNKEERHIKIDNSDGVFMPLSVEFLYNMGKYEVYSFSHYYKQNGDMCPDPDMTFFVEKENKKIGGSRKINFWHIDKKALTLIFRAFLSIVNLIDGNFSREGLTQIRPEVI